MVPTLPNKVQAYLAAKYLVLANAGVSESQWEGHASYQASCFYVHRRLLNPARPCGCIRSRY